MHDGGSEVHAGGLPLQNVCGSLKSFALYIHVLFADHSTQVAAVCVGQRTLSIEREFGLARAGPRQAGRHARESRRGARCKTGFHGAEIVPWCGEQSAEAGPRRAQADSVSKVQGSEGGGCSPSRPATIAREQHTDRLVAGLRGLLFGFQAWNPLLTLPFDHP